MTNLIELIKATEAISSSIHMTNEELVAEIQRLADSSEEADQKLLTTLQAKLFSQNGGMIVQVATRYNRHKYLSSDEAAEVSMAVFTASRKFDLSRGVPFSSCLPWYIKSALQSEHAFVANQSQSSYARNTAKVNNPQSYRAEQISKAEAVLNRVTTLDVRSIESRLTDNVSTEDLFISLSEQIKDEDKRERMLKRSTEAVALLSSEQKQILATLLTPLRTADDFGLRTTSAIAKQLHVSEKYVEDQKQLMFNAIYEHIMETEPDLRPPDWVPNQQGVRLPGMEGFLLGLFGTPTVGEIENYRKVVKKRFSRR